MTTTAAPQPAALSEAAATILDMALDGRRPRSKQITPNRWGGFDARNDRVLVRLTEDDGTWTIRLMTPNEVELGSIRLDGSFARPQVVAATIAGHLL